MNKRSARPRSTRLKKPSNDGLFSLVEETFFNSPMKFAGFAEFEEKVIKATHSDHSLDEELFDLVKQRFEQHIGDDGAHFLSAYPCRFITEGKLRIRFRGL